MVDFKFNGPRYDATTAALRKPSFDFTGPKDPPKPPEPSWLENTGNFALDALRNFNDTATFGLYTKGLEATGIDTNADERLAASKQNNPWASILGETGGYMLPGALAERLVAKAVPQVAGNTLGAVMGREAVSNGLVSGTDDVVRDGTVDPVGVGIDAAMGGGVAGILKGAGHLISPEARVRASGNSLTDADRLGAELAQIKAGQQGIPINVPEAVQAAAPTRSQGVTSVFQDALQTPKGAQVAQSFEAGRGPRIQQAGRDMVNQVGPGADPFMVSNAAGDALERTRMDVQAAAAPDYAAADARALPPSWVPRGAATKIATEAVLNNEVLMEGLIKKNGGNAVKQNSVLFLDAVRKRIDTMTAKAVRDEDTQMVGLLRDAADELNGAMDRVAPTYASARNTVEQGFGELDDLKSGVLGTLADNPDVKAQSGSIFGVDNAVDAGLSREALGELATQDPTLPRGIFANHLDSAVTNNPSGFGKDVLPNDYARMLAGDALGPEFADVSERLGAAALVDPFTGQALPGHDGNPWSKFFAGITNLGKGKIAKLMQDPEMIRRLGKTGPVQEGLTLGGKSLIQSGDFGGRVSGRSRKNRRNAGPLQILIDYDGKP